MVNVEKKKERVCSYMKKAQKSAELLWVFGIIFVALGVAICNKADLGVSMIAAPPFVLYDAVAHLWGGFTVGMLEYLVQGMLLVILCLIIGKFDWRFLLAFAVAVIYGGMLDLFLWLLKDIAVEAVWLRWVLLLVGDVVVGFGVACCFHTYLPLQVYELFVAEVARRFRITIPKVKMMFDASLLVISVVLAFSLFTDAKTFDWPAIGTTSFHSIGLGTLVTTIINSSIIALMDKFICRWFDDTPRFSKLEKVFKHN